MIAALIVAAIVAASLAFMRPGKKSEKYDIVFFGDSIVAGIEKYESIPTMIEKDTGLKTLNCGFGGLTMSSGTKENYPGDFTFFYSMVALSELVKNNELDTLSLALPAEDYIVPAAWNEKVEIMTRLETSGIRYALIEYGINDYMAGKPVDNPDNPYDIKTFGGALRKTIENLQEAIPDVCIVLVTPTYIERDGESCLEKSFGGGTLDAYVTKEFEVAEQYGISVVDNFYSEIINKDNLGTMTYDNLHPNEEGNRLIADNILKRLRKIEGFTQ